MLRLAGCPVRDVSPLGACAALALLDLSACAKLAASALAGAQNITRTAAEGIATSNLGGGAGATLAEAAAAAERERGAALRDEALALRDVAVGEASTLRSELASARRELGEQPNLDVIEELRIHIRQRLPDVAQDAKLTIRCPQRVARDQFEVPCCIRTSEEDGIDEIKVIIYDDGRE